MTKKDYCFYVPHSGQACCYHCGGSYQVTPASLKMAVVITKQFDKEHRRCKKTEAGDALFAKNKAAFESLPENKRSVVGALVLPEPKNLGEKVAQYLYMEEMQKADLGDVKIVKVDKP